MARVVEDGGGSRVQINVQTLNFAFLVRRVICAGSLCVGVVESEEVGVASCGERDAFTCNAR